MISCCKHIIFLQAFLCATLITNAQHDHSMAMDTVEMKDMVEDSMPPMSHAFSLNLPMNRNGSGTGWLPDSTPMFGYMLNSKRWMFMGHGNFFVRYNSQDVFRSGIRGNKKTDAVSWFMFMGQRRMGKRGLLRFNTMFSLDPLFGGDGYPLLFQTGESWQGRSLVDRQHPHDLVSELSIAYAYAINKTSDVFIYAGYPAEPALGSVAFMHRFSSMYNPDAPITHHWNDGTHITFGVMTAGVRWSKFKLDASIYTGREPDENRYNFDMPRFDSYSGRLSFNPNAYWSFQVSEGFNKSPETLHPNEDVYRTTFSGAYSRPLKAGNFFNATALWGMNSVHANENAILAEAVWILKRWAFYGRYEWVEKSREELDLDAKSFGQTSIFSIHAITLGSGYDIVRSEKINIALGGQVTCFLADQRLNNLYGNKPVSGELYLRVYPPRMKMRMK